MHPIAASAKHTMTRLVDALWPGRSLVSGLPARGALSPEDFAALTFITGPKCNMCSQPMPLDLGEDALCAACTTRPSNWAQARAALQYDDVSRIPILALKRAGRRDGLKVMANWMVTAGRPLLDTSDLIVPVPLHYRRLVSRGYNQSGWLAQAIGKQAERPVDHGILFRTRPTPSQAGLSPRARYRNVAGAFGVHPKRLNRVNGKTIILVDDVLTTGATLNAASKALKQAGAAEIRVLVLARVVRERDITI